MIHYELGRRCCAFEGINDRKNGTTFNKEPFPLGGYEYCHGIPWGVSYTFNLFTGEYLRRRARV
ncbi:hypothetical protein KUL49_23780 [Alteromonas sp. KUL49]|nr:hypothetical protein KUL49_23780 [Alteromonas sp. KUL49]